MKCSKCHNIIEQKINCLLCKNIFCSYNCMEAHMIALHKKNFIFNDDTDNENNNIQKKYFSNLNKNNNIKSPYLIPGILNIKRNYDEKYNLDNFIPVFENNKPKIIGCGSFGQVFLVLNTINKKLYAIKHMEKKKFINKIKFIRRNI